MKVYETLNEQKKLIYKRKPMYPKYIIVSQNELEYGLKTGFFRKEESGFYYGNIQVFKAEYIGRNKK